MTLSGGGGGPAVRVGAEVQAASLLRVSAAAARAPLLLGVLRVPRLRLSAR